MKSVHEGQKFPCLQCEFKGTQNGHLQTHIKSVHEGVKFPCSQCEYKATFKTSLLGHIKSIHSTGERKRLPCPSCESNFLHKKGLRASEKQSQETYKGKTFQSTVDKRVKIICLPVHCSNKR